MKSDKGMIEDQRNISVFDVGYETLHAASSLHPQASYRFTCPTTLKKTKSFWLPPNGFNISAQVPAVEKCFAIV